MKFCKCEKAERVGHGAWSIGYIKQKIRFSIAMRFALCSLLSEYNISGVLAEK
jgi:hypothetical protein